LLIAALVAIVNLLLWRAFNPPLTAPDVPSRVAGLAYNGFQRWQSPLSQRFPSDAALAGDLQRLAGLTPGCAPTARANCRCCRRWRRKPACG
jgi:hypothetical protein